MSIRPLILGAYFLFALVAALPPEAMISQWKDIPPDAPQSITTELQLTDFMASSRFVSSIMRGGFGNILFQLAASHSVALKLNATCLVCWWDQRTADALHRPFHGRGPPVPGISLKHIFPNIIYVDFYPSSRKVAKRAFSQFRGVYKKLSKRLLDLKTPFMAGLYFHTRCKSAVAISWI